MYKKILLIALIGSAFLLSCDKNNNDEDNPWPVWILYVNAMHGTSQQPIPSCAEVVWSTSLSSEVHRTTCNDTPGDRPEHVKVWKSIDENLTVFFHVEADGYTPSIEYSVYFDRDLAYTREGAPGDEVIVSQNVPMFPN